MLSESTASPKIAALFDGDDGGRKRRDAIEGLADERGIEIKLLSPIDTTTEDHLIAGRTLYPRALANYLAKMSPRRDDDDNPVSAAEYETQLLSRLDGLDSTKEGLTKGMATWSRVVGKEIGELGDKPSPIGVAREYAFLLESVTADQFSGQDARRSRELVKWIALALDLPPLVKTQEAIFVPEDELDVDLLA
jgi:hypothetical protein